MTLLVKRRVFYSFHFDNDVFRTQQVRQIGFLEGDKPVTPNAWEQLKRTAGGVEKWIDDNMRGKSCVIVLIGSQTSSRRWVNYEIEKAAREGRPILGIHIHNLKCPRNGVDIKGTNPLHGKTFRRRNGLSYMPTVYDPKAYDAYGDISANISSWNEKAMADIG